MRNTCSWVLVLALGAVAVLGPVTRSQAAVAPADPPLTFTYQDAQGKGTMTVQDAGPDAATGGRQIRVSLLQNGVRYNGSGITYALEQSMPFTTLITFTLVSPRGVSYFFRGKTTSGITLSGQGTYNQVGSTTNPAPWSIVLGG
jgi:hypothetical protein